MASITKTPKYECTHKKSHKGTKTLVCEWCSEDYERPSCWPPQQRFCSSWCARRWYAQEYSNEDSPNFKHGITIQGYKRINLGTKRILEHRHVMEGMLGRELSRNETVHHINGIKTDNRPENLQLRNSHHGKGASYVCADCGSSNIVAKEI